MQWLNKLRKAEQKGEEDAQQQLKKAMSRLGDAESKLRKRMRVYPSSAQESAEKASEQAGGTSEQPKTGNDQIARQNASSTRPQERTGQKTEPIISINGEDVTDESDSPAA